MSIKAITSVEEFNTEVLGNDSVAVVDFWAEWCAPCKVMRPEMEAVAAKMGDTVQFFSVDADALKEILLVHGVDGIPSLVAYKNGKEIDRIAGYKKADVLESLLTSIVQG
ncbi:MAG: thioredoxin family protein [Veillonella sp.]|nr:thioredoxin family protein [Veillonella sp.]